MKVFLSWHGMLSKSVALALRDWLRDVIQSVEPFMSAEDIAPGVRWAANLSAELANTTFGIVCLTRENVAAPYINYEVGALSKAVDDQTRVGPAAN